ncbi:MAG: ABC transporter substrate-binding protein [Thermoguttaceae bacterium]|nr:ABC transporter substrate-binding protein [Thermoguttaceae bacterium]
MEKKEKWSVLLIAALTAVFLTSCSTPTKQQKSVKIAYLPITHALAVFEEAEELAAEDGLKIELVKYGSWPELLDALNAGRVDGASVLIELAMKSKQEGIGIKAVALGHRDGNVVVVSNDIQSAADLKGKTFAIPHRQSSHNILLNDTLATAGLTVSDVSVTELPPPEMPSALASRQIDGYCVAEPFGAMGVALGVGKVLFDSKELWQDSLCCGLVLTDKFIAEEPENARELVSRYKAAGNALNKEKAVEIAKKYLNQKEGVLDISLQWISFNNLDITEDTYDALVERVKKYGLSENPPSYADFVKNDL